VSSDRLRPFIVSALVEAFRLSTDDAERLAVVAIANAGASPAIRAGEIVGLCRATRQLPWVAEWWTSEAGQRAFATLPTCPDNAWTALNEACAVPAPDALDPNWPAEKVFNLVELPDRIRPGDEFVVGNGLGDRFVMRAVERAGRTGAELVKAIGGPLDSYWYQAIVEAERIAGPAAE